MSVNSVGETLIAGAAHIISERTKGRVVISSKELIYPETLGIFVKKGNSATHAALMKALSLSRASGEYEIILKKYSLEPISE